MTEHDPYLTALDIPFSLVGDTITLPYTLAYECGLFGSIILFEPQDYQAAVFAGLPKGLDPVDQPAPSDRQLP